MVGQTYCSMAAFCGLFAILVLRLISAALSYLFGDKYVYMSNFALLLAVAAAAVLFALCQRQRIGCIGSSHAKNCFRNGGHRDIIDAYLLHCSEV
jgi:hypothetical protein